MYIIWPLALACLMGGLIWTGLDRAGLSRLPRAVLALLGAAAVSALVYWGGIYLSIFLFQWNDPVTW